MSANLESYGRQAEDLAAKTNKALAEKRRLELQHRPGNLAYLPKRGIVTGFTEINGVEVDPKIEFCIDHTRDGAVYYRDKDNSMRRIKSFVRPKLDEVTNDTETQSEG